MQKKLAKVAMPIIMAMTLLILGTTTVLWAGQPTVPEIDPTTGGTALALIAGAILIIRERRK